MNAVKRNRRYLLLLPFAPGWIIPRIVGTVAFLSHPTWAGLLALLSWIGFKLRRQLARRGSA